MDGYGFTKTECSIIDARMQKRLKMRQEFLKARTDPSKHASQDSGYVFDPAVQRYLSMKSKSLDTYRFTFMNGLKSFAMIVLPMVGYGGLVYMVRSEKEERIRTGQLKYRDRTFKLC